MLYFFVTLRELLFYAFLKGCGLLLVQQTELFKTLIIPAQSLSLFSGRQEDYWLNGSSLQEKLPCFFYPS